MTFARASLLASAVGRERLTASESMEPAGYLPLVAAVEQADAIDVEVTQVVRVAGAGPVVISRERHFQGVHLAVTVDVSKLCSADDPG
jgi:hypothetical protein